MVTARCIPAKTPREEGLCFFRDLLLFFRIEGRLFALGFLLFCRCFFLHFFGSFFCLGYFGRRFFLRFFGRDFCRRCFFGRRCFFDSVFLRFFIRCGNVYDRHLLVDEAEESARGLFDDMDDSFFAADAELFQAFSDSGFDGFLL